MSTRRAQVESPHSVTVPFQELVTKRIQQEPEFASALLEEALERLVANDVVTAQLLLRDVVNGTIGFRALASATGLMEKSLMRRHEARFAEPSSTLITNYHTNIRSPPMQHKNWQCPKCSNTSFSLPFSLKRN